MNRKEEKGKKNGRNVNGGERNGGGEKEAVEGREEKWEKVCYEKAMGGEEGDTEQYGEEDVLKGRRDEGRNDCPKGEL